MKNVAHLISQGRQELWLPPRALQQEFHPFFEQTVERMRGKLIDTVVIDGRPGAGKTQFSVGLSRFFDEAGVPFSKVSTDDDTLPRAERNGHELIDFHPGGVVREALSVRHGGGGLMSYDRYSGKSGKIDDPTQVEIHRPGEGVLLVEGVRSIEHVQQAVGSLRSEVESRVLYVLLDEPAAIANKRRAQRDVQIKGLSEEEAHRRLKTQERMIKAYYGDLERELRPHFGSSMDRRQL